jgi:hypothetical protein
MESIAEHAEANRLFRLKTTNLPGRPLTQKVFGDLSDLNEQIKRISGGEIDIPSLAFLGLAGAGLYQIMLGEFLIPAWYTAFWYASNVLMKAKGPDS